MTESDLESLGIHRIPVPVPFPQAGGPVNVYLVDEPEGGLLMFDAGLGTPAAEAALSDGFARLGRRFGEVSRIVLSHGHVDHFGAARTVQERAGREVAVFAHRDDLGKVAESGRRWRELAPRYAAYLLRLGVPAAVLGEAGKTMGASLSMARRLPQVTPLEPGTVLRTRHLELEVHHMPGHTPGLLCLYERRRGLFFSADHLLERISPNPLMDLGPDGEEGRYRPLVSYLESVGRLRALEVALVLPGHGPPFAGHRRVIDGLLEFFQARQEKIRQALAGAPQTAYQIMQALFPWARPADLFLAMSEAIANVEVLEVRGEVRRSVAEDGAYRFGLRGV